MFGIVFYSTYWGLFRFKRFHSSYKMRSSAKVKYFNFQKSKGTRTLYSWLATNLLLVHPRQCSLIKSQNTHDMVYLFCDKIFFCVMPPDMAADVQVKNRANVKICPVQLSSPGFVLCPIAGHLTAVSASSDGHLTTYFFKSQISRGLPRGGGLIVVGFDSYIMD